MNQLSNEISLVPFRFKYLKALHDLLESNNYQGIEVVNMKTLPKTGYIALMNGHPIAAGFLRRVEGGYGQLDTLTSNKHFGSIIRHQGIQLVTDALIQDAIDLRLHGLMAFSSDQGVLKRSVDKGWTEIKQTIMAVNLIK